MSIFRVAKDKSYVHVLYNDVKGPYLHEILGLMEKSKIIPEHILHQAPPTSFSNAARKRTGYYGSYVIRGLVSKKEPVRKINVAEEELREKLVKTARTSLSLDLSIKGSVTTSASILHSFYQQLDRDEILAFATYSAQDFLSKSVSSFAKCHEGKLKIIDNQEIQPLRQEIQQELHNVVLDAESLLAHEEDIVNRVHNLAIRRIGSNGLSPDHVRLVKDSISDAERMERWERRRIDLLCDFGRWLGFDSLVNKNNWIGVAWVKPGMTQCNFELQKKGLRVFSGSNPDNYFEWGEISYFDFEYKMWEWCQKDPIKRRDLLNKLNHFDGPSYSTLVKTKQEYSTSDRQNFKMKVLQNRNVCPQHFLIQLEIPRGKMINPLPGQFFHIVCDPNNCDKNNYPLTLRRPFSIHGTQYEGFNRSLLASTRDIPEEIREIIQRWPSKIDFLYKVLGDGTRSLSQIKKGTYIDVIGPCGNGFTIGKSSTDVIVAGGIGIAPLVALVERLRYLDKKVYIYLGAVKKDLLYLAITHADRADSAIDGGFANGTQGFYEMIKNDFHEIGADEIKICTDDGSVGKKSLVTQILEQDICDGIIPRKDACFYACGPQGMLKSISDISVKYLIDCQILMEERMACGVGACLSCSVDIIGPDGVIQKERVCKDGPVFKASEVKWNG